MTTPCTTCIKANPIPTCADEWILGTVSTDYNGTELFYRITDLATGGVVTGTTDTVSGGVLSITFDPATDLMSHTYKIQIYPSSGSSEVINFMVSDETGCCVEFMPFQGSTTTVTFSTVGCNETPAPIAPIQDFVFVDSADDLPDPVAGVITLGDNVTYFFTRTVDLNGDRLIAGENTTILGGSSENCRIKSTGLGATALITSQYSLPMRNITIEADLAIDLNGDGVTTALDWFGVNFTDCANVGTIANYSNFIIADSAFLNSGGLTFDGTIGTIGISQCLFDCNAGNSVFTLPSTLTITRRFRIIYSSLVVLAGETGIDVDALATIPTEAYILDTVNFSGGGTYLSGVNHTSNDALFINCTNITNTAVNGQLYMQNNATATVVAAPSTFYKVLGTTTASADNSKFIHSNNRLTCDAIISRKYLIQANLSFTSGNNNICEFGFYDSQIAGIRTPSRTLSTANASGRAENITMFCVVEMNSGDYLEVHCANNTGANNITVSSLNFVVTEIR